MVTEAEARAKVDAEAPAETQAANDSPGSGEGKGHGHIPMSDSTQWDIVNGQAERVEPVWEELVWQAAQGDVVHHDDTGVKILELMGERARQAALEDSGGDTAEDSAEDAAKELPPDRTGMFTSAIVATGDGHKIALFLSGRQHAGENLKDVLRRRAAELPPPIQMCDALPAQFFVLQDSARCPRGGHVYEPHRHQRTVRGEPLRLPH
jgi:hypothetical protein